MRILLLNHYAGRDDLGMEYRPSYLAAEWVRQGHEVTVVGASFSHLRQHQPRVNGLWATELVDGVRYVWLRGLAYQGNGSRRALSIFWFVFLLFASIPWVLLRRPSLVIASSTYPLDVLPAFAMARLAGARIVHEVHDLWPLTLIELGGMSPSHPFVRVLQWAEDFSYRHVDKVVSMLPGAYAYMKDHGLDESRYAFVPNGITAKAITAAEGRAELDEPHKGALAEVKASGDFIVGYAGGHSISNALDTLIEAAAILRDEPIRFVLIGDGIDKARLEEKADALGLQNVRFLPPVAKALVPSALEACDILYVAAQKRFLYRFGVGANKILDYMLAAKPIVQSMDVIQDLVRDVGCGCTVPAADPAALAEAIRAYRRMSREERDSQGRRGRDYVIDRHRYEVLARHFLTSV